jgi:uncharacterized lipoprotein YddW (UPF0748 family)
MKARWTMIAMMGVLMAVAVFIVAALSDTQPELTFQNPETDVADHPQTTTQSETEQQSEMEEPAMEELYQAHTPGNIKAMWLSQFDLNAVYTDGGRQRAKSDYRVLIARVLDRVVETGINTVIVQLRPNMDSMYPSEICPMSKYVVGKYGLDAAYDPFEILLAEAHKRGLSVHAWINPLRGMLTDEILAISDQYRVRQLYDDPMTRMKVLVEHEGRWYLNPAYEEARELIVSGAREILLNYDVDGLHMDDYFYPTTDGSFDKVSYNRYIENGGKVRTVVAYYVYYRK